MRLTFGSRFPLLQTERLTLRRITFDDAKAVLRHFGDPRVAEHMDIEPLPDLRAATEIIAWTDSLFEADLGIRWALVERESGDFLGTAGYNSWVKERGYRAELGYDLSPAYWGQGYMREALRAVLEYGFTLMQLRRVEAFVFPANTRSRRLLGNLGFTEEGLLRDHGFYKGRFWDELIFSLLDDERPPGE